MSKMKVYHYRENPENDLRLREAAAFAGVTKSELVRAALANATNRLLRDKVLLESARAEQER